MISWGGLLPCLLFPSRCFTNASPFFRDSLCCDCALRTKTADSSSCLCPRRQRLSQPPSSCVTLSSFWLNALDAQFALMYGVWLQKGNCSTFVLFSWRWLFLGAIVAFPEDDLRGRDGLCPLGDRFFDGLIGQWGKFYLYSVHFGEAHFGPVIVGLEFDWLYGGGFGASGLLYWFFDAGVVLVALPRSHNFASLGKRVTALHWTAWAERLFVRSGSEGVSARGGTLPCEHNNHKIMSICQFATWE